MDSAGLRVASFNVRNGRAWDGLDSWPLRRRATADAVARLDADVIGLQEVYGFQQRYLCRRLPEYRAGGAGRNDGGRRGERCTVLFRSRLHLERQRTRWFSDTPDSPGSRAWESRLPRIVTMVRFRDAGAGGRRFGLADLHLEGGSLRSRERSAEALVGWLDRDLPWIVLGDFNAAPDDPSLAVLAAAGLRDAVLEGAGGDPGPTELRGRRRIDHIFVTAEWKVGAAAVRRFAPHRRRASDHWPVTATLELR